MGIKGILHASIVSAGLLSCGFPNTEHKHSHSTILSSPPSDQDFTKATAEGVICGASLQSLSNLVSQNKNNLQRDEKIKQTTSECLSSFIKVKTINPPGWEVLGVKFLEQIFDAIKIPYMSYEIKKANDEKAQKRWNLVATLSIESAAAGKDVKLPFAWHRTNTQNFNVRPSFILLNHIDVVAVYPDQWENPDYPFSGIIAPTKQSPDGEKFIWGRGALDMKSISVMQFVSMAVLKAAKESITKDIHFLAVADEEQEAIGAIETLKEIQPNKKLEALMGAKGLLNEGGFGAEGVLGKNTVMHVVGTQEKGGAWLNVTHDSVNGLMSAIQKMTMVQIPDSRRWLERFRGQRQSRFGCKVVKLFTPQAKFNVVPSKIEIDFDCTDEPDAFEIEETFRSGFDHVTVSSDKKENKLHLTVATASSSHGSLSLNASALDVVLTGLIRTGMVKQKYFPQSDLFDYVQTSATKDLLNTTGANHNLRIFGWPLIPNFSHLGDAIHFIGFIERNILGIIGNQLSSERLFRTSCSWTGLDYTEGSTANAMIDCRILKTKEGHVFVTQIQELLADQNATVKGVHMWDFSSSEKTEPLFKAIEDVIREASTEEVKHYPTSYLSPAGSDMTYFRNPKIVGVDLAPIPSYGFFPMDLPTSIIGTIHGSNERLSVEKIGDGVRRYYQVIKRFSTSALLN